MKLKRCPCGQIPKNLILSESASSPKYANVSGDCCQYWEVEFRTEFHSINFEEEKKWAIEAWNDAPRDKLLDTEGTE